MSLQSWSGRRWQKVRRASGRVPLRIKLISVVLALVLIALGAISIGGITLLRNYLLGPVDADLFASQDNASHYTERCLSPGPSVCPLPAGGQLVDWLSASGHLQRIVVRDLDVANTLLSHAADAGTDFIVMGGYGHSRLRELILGGATRGILQSMTVPTLMSH